MEIEGKKVLVIDLKNKTSEAKTYKDLNKFVGGIGLGLKLLEMFREENPIIFSVGPLNGFFPFASKTSVVLSDSGVVEDLYIGGNLSLRIRFAGLDSIILCGKSNDDTILDILNTQAVFKPKETEIKSLGLPGKKSVIDFREKKLVVGDYFSTPEHFLESLMKEKRVCGLSITGTEFYKPKDFDAYEKLYKDILLKKNELSVETGIYPSCSNCPMGCGKSKFGEIGGNVLLHSLVSCQYADKVYSDIGIVFSCLNSLGYDYTHEDLENLPKLIESTLKDLS